MLSPRQRLSLFLVLAAGVSVPLSAKKNKHTEPVAAQLTEQQRALHALNRLTFGQRPGDVERVMAIGVDKWIEQQLHPEKINDSALEARLALFRTLKMDTRAMLENFPPPQMIKAVADGKVEMPKDPDTRAIYQAQLERYREQQERKQEKGDAASGNPVQLTDEQKAARHEQRRVAEQRLDSLMEMTPEQRFRELLRMDDADRRALAALPPAERQRMASGMTPQQRETLLALISPQAVIVSELQQAKLLRATYSERQLEEVMTDFWFNHFNVFLGKGADRYMITSYERDVIRPHALGKFKDLLVATAKSPAMLFYLDNWQSVGPESQFASGRPQVSARKARARTWGTGRPARTWGRAGGIWGPFGSRIGMGTRIPVGQPPQRSRNPQPGRQQQRKRSGLNENYARELMELHTLGVDGGYTQQDVTQVARVFTGWTLAEPRKGGEFTFNERMHEPGSKTVLGKQIKEHGEDEGMQVLDMLAHHPSTAHFISTKLAERFVSDTPPRALVDRMAERFLSSDGDIREVLRTMFRSPEFWSPDSYRKKVKTPLEFVASAVRASGAETDEPMPLVQTLNRMGMPLYGAQPPTGYSMKAETWVNSAALLDRMNFAVALAAGKMPGLTVDPEELLTAYHIGKHKKLEAEPVSADNPDTLLAQLESALLAGDVSRQTHETVRKQLVGDQVGTTATQVSAGQTGANLGHQAGSVQLITGLLLGSPEFQRR
jgi:uncharacterized protein (DUF1800 family)